MHRELPEKVTAFCCRSLVREAGSEAELPKHLTRIPGFTCVDDMHGMQVSNAVKRKEEELSCLKTNGLPRCEAQSKASSKGICKYHTIYKGSCKKFTRPSRPCSRASTAEEYPRTCLFRSNFAALKLTTACWAATCVSPPVTTSAIQSRVHSPFGRSEIRYPAIVDF